MKTNARHAKKGLFLKSLLAISVLACLLCVLIACDKGSSSSAPSAVLGDDFKTTYYVGDDFTPGGTLSLYRGDRFVSFETITEDMVSGFDTESARDIIVTISKGKYSTTALVHVLPLVATSIALNEDTLPSVVYKGSIFPSGATLTAHMSNGTTRSDVPITASMLGGFDTNQTGRQLVSVGYFGSSQTFFVLVKEDEPKSLSFSGLSDTYEVGDGLVVTDATVTVHYESDNSYSVPLLATYVSGFSTALGGDFEATISYGGLTCKYPYSVIKAATSLSLKEDTFSFVFEKGDPFPVGAKGVLTFNDASPDEEVDLTAANVPDFDTTSFTTEPRTVKVMISGVSTDYTYSVLPDVLTDATAPNGFTSAVKQGSVFDGLGELVVHYEDGSSEGIAFNSDRLRVFYDTSKVGDVEQTVTFRGATYSFLVHVYSESEERDIAALNIAGVFRPIKEGDPIDVTGVQVNVVYKYLDSEIVACRASWVTIDPHDPITGDYADVDLTVTLGGASVHSTVRVLSAAYAARATSLTISGVRTLLVVGDALDAAISEATMSVVYGGGYAAEYGLSLSLAEVGGFDASAAGTGEMTVTYKGCESEPIAYRVISEEEKALITAIDLPSFSPILFVGDTLESVDPAPYKVLCTFGYGYSTNEVALELSMLSGGPFDTAGEREVTLTYGGAVKVLSVTVHPAEDRTRPTSIKVADEISSVVGSSPDFSQYRLRVTYGYGISSEVISLAAEGVTIDPFSNTETGWKRITVHYAGLQCTAFVAFVTGSGENVIRTVEVSSQSTRVFAQNAELSGVSLLVTYADNHRESVVVTAAMAPDFDTREAGEHTVTITYGGRGLAFTYEVSES